jgi:hypothetical protein
VWIVRGGQVAGGKGLQLSSTLTRFGSVAARGDFDGDGSDDILLARSRRGAVDIVYLEGSEAVGRESRNAPGTRWQVIATPDADGDGVAEIVWENVDTHALSIESMAAPGRFTPLSTQPGDWRVLGSDDVDGDGRDDLLMRQRRTRRVAAWLLGGGSPKPSSWSATPDRYREYRGLGDFDGDGRADAFWHHPDGSVQSVEPALVSEPTTGDELVGDDGD